MDQTPRHILVVSHTGRQSSVNAAVCRQLLAEGVTPVVQVDQRAAILTQAPDLSSIATFGVEVGVHDVELVIVLGGDGTILRGAEWVVGSRISLLGVNLGHVGFLAEAESSEVDSIVTRVVERSYTVEERFTITVNLRECESSKVVWSSYAINEVSIEKASRERMLEVLLEVDHRPLSRYACDGMLVATPTGSTAYAFSAGGPVVWPGVEAMLVVPLSAHALFARPLVLSPTSTVVIEVIATSQGPARVWCDGRRRAAPA